ncbi:acyl carrier protein [Streptomyces niveus]|uniref:acyl carrier protein n=1 Tax=Streptomyces niveus TaxID=193462 RepID=UPI00341E7735
MTSDSLTREVLDLLTSEYEAPADTSPDTDFERLGFDSLILVEVGVDLTKRYGVEIGDDELRTAGNVTRTVELLLSKRASA